MQRYFVVCLVLVGIAAVHCQLGETGRGSSGSVEWHRKDGRGTSNVRVARGLPSNGRPFQAPSAARIEVARRIRERQRNAGQNRHGPMTDAERRMHEERQRAHRERIEWERMQRDWQRRKELERAAAERPRNPNRRYSPMRHEGPSFA